MLLEHIDAFREAVRQVCARRPFHIDAWVVLPDHTHCIWTLPPDDSDYSARWKAIKIAFSKSLPKTERLSAVRVRKGERGIWQRRFWEHTIRDERDYAAHVDYVHINPFKHGLVRQVSIRHFIASLLRTYIRTIVPARCLTWLRAKEVHRHAAEDATLFRPTALHPIDTRISRDLKQIAYLNLAEYFFKMKKSR